MRTMQIGFLMALAAWGVKAEVAPVTTYAEVKLRTVDQYQAQDLDYAADSLKVSLRTEKLAYGQYRARLNVLLAAVFRYQLSRCGVNQSVCIAKARQDFTDSSRVLRGDLDNLFASRCDEVRDNWNREYQASLLKGI